MKIKLKCNPSYTVFFHFLCITYFYDFMLEYLYLHIFPVSQTTKNNNNIFMTIKIRENEECNEKTTLFYLSCTFNVHCFVVILN